MKLLKLTGYYLLWNIVLSPIMFIIFAFSAMLYDSGIPDNLADHFNIVFFALYIFLIPSLSVIARAKKSLFENKNIGVSYAESYIIGGIIAFIPSVIFTAVHINPTTLMEIFATIITPIIEIGIFICANYMYNTNQVINVILRKLGKIVGYGFLILIVLQILISQIPVYY